MHWSAARPLLTVATILAVTAVTSCSLSSATPADVRAVSSRPAATPAATKVSVLGQADADSLSLRAKQYLNGLDTSGKTTWSVTFSREASSASGELTFVGFISPADGSLQPYNQSVASACGSKSSSVLAAGHPTGATFLTVRLDAYSSYPDLEIQEWDAVAPSAAIQALTQMATTCGSRLVFAPTPQGVPLVYTFVAQPVQVLGSPAVAIQTTQTPGRKPWNSLVVSSKTRMLVVSSRGWSDGGNDKPALANDVLVQLASALLSPSGG
jgi:hypothetical protein